MIRTKTTVVVGAGAAVEVDLPDPRDMLGKINQGYDFQRLGTDLARAETGDFDALFKKLKGKAETLKDAAQRLRAGSRLSTSIHALLQQHGNDDHVIAVGKLALAYYTLRAEQDSPTTDEPRDPGEMPLRGGENWLFQLGRMAVDGVPRAKADSSFDNLTFISFGTDRTIQHYMPWVLHSGFGMGISEARAICAEKLRVIQPFGRAGRLPWMAGDEAVADWGDLDLAKLFNVADGLRTADEFINDRQARAALSSAVSKSRRLVFLGFDFTGMEVALLFDDRLQQVPDVLAALRESEVDREPMITRVLDKVGGIGPDAVIAMPVTSSWKMLRDYSQLLES